MTVFSYVLFRSVPQQRIGCLQQFPKMLAAVFNHRSALFRIKAIAADAAAHDAGVADDLGFAGNRFDFLIALIIKIVFHCLSVNPCACFAIDTKEF